LKGFFPASLETMGIKEISDEIKLENVKNVEQVFHRLGRSGTMIGRPSKAGKRTQLEIGLFDCPRARSPSEKY
jgi:hypothetical protein